jgi:hypothetical protein
MPNVNDLTKEQLAAVEAELRKQMPDFVAAIEAVYRQYGLAISSDSDGKMEIVLFRSAGSCNHVDELHAMDLFIDSYDAASYTGPSKTFDQQRIAASRSARDKKEG